MSEDRQRYRYGYNIPLHYYDDESFKQYARERALTEIGREIATRLIDMEDGCVFRIDEKVSGEIKDPEERKYYAERSYRGLEEVHEFSIYMNKVQRMEWTVAHMDMSAGMFHEPVHEIVCEACGTVNPLDAIECRTCHAPLYKDGQVWSDVQYVKEEVRIPNGLVCGHCGNVNKTGDTQCRVCHAPLEVQI